jgi:hypothetical protein
MMKKGTSKRADYLKTLDESLKMMKEEEEMRRALGIEPAKIDQQVGQLNGLENDPVSGHE